MKKIILDFFKGIAIGIANVIPGFSGGTMAIILNVYERFIGAIGMIFKHPIRAIKDVWSLFLGLAIGIVIAIFSIVKLLEYFPVPTTLFFVGLIIGSLPTLFKTTKQYGKAKVLDYIFLIIAALVVVGIALLKPAGEINTDLNVWFLIIIFVCGLISAVAMIIPGVSGSLILMALGYYMIITSTIDNLFDNFLTWNFDGFLNNFLVILSFAIGILLGIVAASRVISWLLKKYSKIVYFTIIGLLLTSPFAIIYAVIKDYNEQVRATKPLSYIIAVLFLALGAFLTGVVSNYKKKDKIEIVTEIKEIIDESEQQD